MKDKRIYLLGFISFFVYLNSVFNPFIWDDFFLIVNNPYIKSFKNFRFYFTTDLFRGGSSNFYRPFQTIIYALIYKIFGLNPVPYHLLNIFLHIGCSILFFLLLKEIYGERIAFLSSLLWAIHPINTEAVTYISGTADPLFLFFGLISILFFIRKKRLLSYLFFVFSLLSKEMALIIPFCLLFYLWAKNEKIKKDIIPLFLISIIYGILRYTILKFCETPMAPFEFRFYTSFKSFIYYLYLLIFPKVLSMARAYPYLTSPVNLWFISGLFFFLFSIYLLLKFKNKKNLIFPYILFLINFFSISGLFVYINATLSEHFIYPCSIGILFYFIFLIEKMKIKKLKTTLFIIIFSLYGLRTIFRNYDWKDPIKFYEKAISQGFKHKKIYYNLAATYLSMGDYKKALEIFKIAEPLYKNKKVVYQGIANSYYKLGNFKEAENYYKKVLEIEPFDPIALTSLATIYFNKKIKPIDEIKEILKLCIQKNPAYREAYNLLGRIFYEEKNYIESIKYFKISISINPDDDIPYLFLGFCYFNLGDKLKSEFYLKKAYKLNPNKIENILNLAIFYKNIGLFKESIKYYEEAIKKGRTDLDTLNDLALCYALLGEKEKAKTLWKEILKNNPGYKPAILNLKAIEK
ncbi:MAG: tetratricopeptide repeat protein [Candidatus Omnitrophica bacterium]|nr:tetratricopeptide repeat protein [Candidatus Omnitrophota bacterium]